MGHHCCSKQRVKRGLWSPEEDDKLIRHITIHGHGSWSSVPKLSGLERCGKSCRLRWINYLRPDLKKGSFSEQEERTIIDVHRMLGNKWAQIAKHLPGRTDNEVKNFWNSSIKKKLIAQGLDPNTHNLISYTQNNKKPYPPLPLPLPPHHGPLSVQSLNGMSSALILTKQEQSLHALVDSSLTFPSSGFGVLDKSCMWDGNLQPSQLQPNNSNLQIVTEMEDDQKVGHVLNHQINGFDFDFMESILQPPNCGMYHNLTSSMDQQLAWD